MKIRWKMPEDQPLVKLECLNIASFVFCLLKELVTNDNIILF